MTNEEIHARFGMSPFRFMVINYTMIFIFYKLIGMAEDYFGFSIHWTFQFIISLITASVIMARNADDYQEKDRRP